MKLALKQISWAVVALVSAIVYHAFTALSVPMYLMAQSTPGANPFEALPEKYGALGVLVVASVGASITLWRRLVQTQDRLAEEWKRDKEEQAALNKETAMALRSIADSLLAMRNVNR